MVLCLPASWILFNNENIRSLNNVLRKYKLRLSNIETDYVFIAAYVSYGDYIQLGQIQCDTWFLSKYLG